jgi:hypothetical protein
MVLIEGNDSSATISLGIIAQSVSEIRLSKAGGDKLFGYPPKPKQISPPPTPLAVCAALSLCQDRQHPGQPSACAKTGNTLDSPQPVPRPATPWTALSLCQHRQHPGQPSACPKTGNTLDSRPPVPTPATPWTALSLCQDRQHPGQPSACANTGNTLDSPQPVPNKT